MAQVIPLANMLRSNHTYHHKQDSIFLVLSLDSNNVLRNLASYTASLRSNTHTLCSRPVPICPHVLWNLLEWSIIVCLLLCNILAWWHNGPFRPDTRTFCNCPPPKILRLSRFCLGVCILVWQFLKKNDKWKRDNSFKTSQIFLAHFF